VPVTLVEGDNVLKAKARDEAGNESSYSEELTLTVDRTPPEIEAAVSPLWQRTSQPVTLTAVVTETDPPLPGRRLGRGSRPRPGHPLPGAGYPLADHLHRRAGGSLHRHRSRQRPGGERRHRRGKGIHPG
jgi:hypothetical protein